MAHYNIIHIDDNASTISDVGKAATQQSLTYCSADSLDSLDSLLQNDSADVFVVDGMFPVRTGEEVQYLAPNAIEKIRARQLSARIVLYSGEEDIAAKAAKLSVDFLRKGGVTGLARDLVTKVKTMIEEPIKV